MPKDIPIKIKLVIPMVIALVCIMLAFGRTWQGVFDLTLNLIFIAYNMRVENAVLIRMLLLGAAAVAIGRYLFMDYSNVFPSSLAMRVFYGEKGIAESLKAVPAPLRASLPVPSDDPQSYRERFLKDLDREIETAIGAVGFFSKPDSVQGYGEVKNLIQKRSGWQHYYLAASEGWLTHTATVPGQHLPSFRSRFEKIPTADDYLSWRFRDVIRGVILRTEYSQSFPTIRVDDSGVKFTVTAMTPIRVFPRARIFNTIYFKQFEGAGLIPIAYAVYE